MIINRIDRADTAHAPSFQGVGADPEWVYRIVCLLVRNDLKLKCRETTLS